MVFQIVGVLPHYNTVSQTTRLLLESMTKTKHVTAQFIRHYLRHFLFNSTNKFMVRLKLHRRVLCSEAERPVKSAKVTSPAI
jgi:hypothetical protein